MTSSRAYQFNFSKMLPEAMYDCERREKKAKTIVAVFKNYFKADLKFFSVLDVGCSTGFIASYLADYCGQVIGIDIDEPAIDFAQANLKKNNLKFLKSDSMAMEFPANHFDIVICAQVYEHVPDATKLMAQIFRILKPGGICYFAAGNRLNFMEAHYKLPFLSMLPRSLGHFYVRIARKGEFYYEKHFSYWTLKKLASDFERIDYTKKIIENPQQFHIHYMLQPGSLKCKIAKLIVNKAYWLCPTYIWLLKKPLELSGLL
jgi:2-polyprenyl-3-methyl-5-hydroxy-6-metoxy-1,4-benzoquinol methylase